MKAIEVAESADRIALATEAADKIVKDAIEAEIKLLSDAAGKLTPQDLKQLLVTAALADKTGILAKIAIPQAPSQGGRENAAGFGKLPARGNPARG